MGLLSPANGEQSGFMRGQAVCAKKRTDMVERENGETGNNDFRLQAERKHTGEPEKISGSGQTGMNPVRRTGISPVRSGRPEFLRSGMDGK